MWGKREGTVRGSFAHTQWQEAEKAAWGSSQLLCHGFAPFLPSMVLLTLLQGSSFGAAVGRGFHRGPWISQEMSTGPGGLQIPRAARGRGRGSRAAPSPAPSARPQHVPTGSTSVTPTRGASPKKLDFANTFCGHCFNSPVSQHSPKPEKLRWFLLCGEGGSCCRSLTYARITHTETLIPLPSHFPPPNDFKHFMKMLFSPKLLPFCLALLSSLLAFPGLPVCWDRDVPAEGGRCWGG